MFTREFCGNGSEYAKETKQAMVFNLLRYKVLQVKRNNAFSDVFSDIINHMCVADILDIYTSTIANCHPVVK